MSYDKRKKRRSLRKKLRITLIAFVLLYLVFRSMPIIFAGNLKTTLAKVDILKEEFQVDGFIIKDEEVYIFDGDGSIDKKIDEGERVAVGKDVANVNFLKDISKYKQELEDVENSIKILSSRESLDITSEKEEIVIKDREESMEKIQEQINKGDFREIIPPKDKVESANLNSSEIFQDEELLNSTLESLEKKRQSLKSKINENNRSYKTESSGIISYEIDGYENILLPENFENYTYNTLENLEKERSQEILNGFKIIDNFHWYLALKVEDKEDIEEYEENSLMKIGFIDPDKNITGKIISINNTGDNAVVVLEFRDYFQDYYNMRFSKVNVLKSINEGFRIPKSTVIEKDSQEGVYIKDFNGIVKFRPVNIIGEENQYYFVDMGKSGRIDLANKEDSVKTIGLYDEIFLKPKNIKEGQIVN